MPRRAPWRELCDGQCGRRADHGIPPMDPPSSWRFLCGPCEQAEGAVATFQAWREARIAADTAAAVERGTAWWRAKGIEPGARVKVWGSSLYGRFPIFGTAKVDRRGPFVHAKVHGRMRALEAGGAEPA